MSLGFLKSSICVGEKLIDKQFKDIIYNLMAQWGEGTEMGVGKLVVDFTMFVNVDKFKEC